MIEISILVLRCSAMLLQDKDQAECSIQSSERAVLQHLLATRKCLRQARRLLCLPLLTWFLGAVFLVGRTLQGLCAVRHDRFG